jgi:DNA polymerase-1
MNTSDGFPGLEAAGRGQLVLIVDGHALAYRAYHAIQKLTSPVGEPTNAIFGFIKMAMRMRDQVKPTHGLVAWDGGLDEQRMAALPQYKAQRPEMPEALRVQLDPCVEWLDAWGMTSCRQDGVEADDWIATMADQAVRSGAQVVIASPDKDFLQLVGPDIRILGVNDQAGMLLDEAAVQAKSGVLPKQIVDWLSLVGDNVDNIPGVPGVGPKTAAKLLGQFGSIDGIFTRLDQVESATLRDRLAGCEDRVRMNQKLVRLNKNLANRFALKDLELKPADNLRLKVLYGKWGFKRLLQDLEPAGPMQARLF